MKRYIYKMILYIYGMQRYIYEMIPYIYQMKRYIYEMILYIYGMQRYIYERIPYIYGMQRFANRMKIFPKHLPPPQTGSGMMREIPRFPIICWAGGGC